MKQTILFIAVLLIWGQLHAQVTIGSEIKPNEGSLLDLKEYNKLGVNSRKGLGLPRVQLTTISSLDDIDTGLDKDEHVGLVIYVPKEFEDSCPGVYVWTGSKWVGINTNALRAPEFITTFTECIDVY